METGCGLQHVDVGTSFNGHGSPQNRAWLIDQLVTHLTGGGSLLLTGVDGAAAVLAATADILAKGRTRVLTVRPPLDLPGIMEQIGRSGHAPGDDDVERGFNALTTLEPACDRVVLVVEDAHLLPHTTLFYLQFVLRAKPPLQLALAGHVEVADALALEGFAGLRACISLHLTMAAPSLNVFCSAAQAGRYGGIRRILGRVFTRSAAYAGLTDAFRRLRRSALAAKDVPVPVPVSGSAEL